MFGVDAYYSCANDIIASYGEKPGAGVLNHLDLPPGAVVQRPNF
jgi:uncharacterized protein YfeS